VRAPSINAALRFFFTVTLDRSEMARHLTFVREPRKIPVILSPEEVARLTAAPGPKYKAALSAAYAAGLRVSEVVALKVSVRRHGFDPGHACGGVNGAIVLPRRHRQHRITAGEQSDRRPGDPIPVAQQVQQPSTRAGAHCCAVRDGDHARRFSAAPSSPAGSRPGSARSYVGLWRRARRRAVARNVLAAFRAPPLAE
jgi:hypothetical protein